MKTTNKAHKSGILLIGLFIIALVVGGSFYDYIFNSEKIVKTRLLELAKNNNDFQKSVVEDKLTYTRQMLHSYSLIAAEYNNLANPKLLELLKENSDEDHFLRMSITLRDGTSYAPDGSTYNSSEREYFKEGMKGNDFISNTFESLVDKQTIICVSAPIRKEGKVIGVLHNTITTAELKSLLNSHNDVDDVASNLIQSDGTTITHEFPLKYTNYFTYLNKDLKQNADSISTLESEINSRKTGSFSILDKNKTSYAFYTPIENTDWSLITYLPYRLIDGNVSKNLTNTINLALRIGGVIVGIALYIIISNYRSNKKVRYINNELDALIANAPGCLLRFTLDDLTSFEFVNDEFFQLSGYTREEMKILYANDYRKLIMKEDLAIFNKTSLDDCQIGQTYTYSYRILHKNGIPFWIYENRHLVEESNGEIWFYISLIDINELKQTQQKLKISEERYQMIINQTESVVFDWDISSDVIVFSSLWESKYGYKKTFYNFLQVLSKVATNDDIIGLLDMLIKGEKRGVCEYKLPLPNGEFHWCKISAQSTLDSDGYLLNIFGSIEDIDVVKRKTIDLEEKSKHDGMTKVLNKTTIEAAIKQVLLTKSGMQHLLIVLDIDDFKEINDTYGHIFGDHVLMEISAKIRTYFRQHDYIGRIGGDEFIIFMNSLDSLTEDFIHSKLNALLTAFDDIHFDEHPEFHVTCSIGAAIFPIDGITYNDLFKAADDALYTVKRKNKHGYALHSHDK